MFYFYTPLGILEMKPWWEMGYYIECFTGY